MRQVARYGVAVAGTALGGLLALGCVIAAHFELTGFGRRDGDPRPLYLGVLTVAFVVCVAAPLALWRLAGAGRSTIAITAGIVAAGMLVLLGVSAG